MLRAMSEGGEVARALKMVLEKIKSTTLARSAEPRLVAVSKIKPKEMIIEAYNAGQRHFGENYVEELFEKAHDIEIKEKCPDIRWHMIGPIQSKKVKKVATSPNIHMVETVHSVKLATLLDSAWKRYKEGSDNLNVFVQVNTSNEAQKSGVPPEEVLSLTAHIRDHCPCLRLRGLMTIGSFDHDLSSGPNPDFQSLIACREVVCKAHDLEIRDLELSMGMSGDYQHAIDVGSTNVRVGSTIFGARDK